MELENKVPEQINDIKKENFEKLAQLFPSIIKDGQVDFKALKEELGEFEEVKEERYEFTWTGKQNAKKKVQEDVGARTLKYIEEDSKNPDTTENLYIEGDNLEVLKLLRQNYYGSIKMIYIDPPYNTDGDFIYNDSFKMTKEENDLSLGYIDEDNQKLQKNKKDGNRYHANWLNMMYSRLLIARDLLSEDGIIFISIDDNEMAQLKLLCNEIFGEDNYIENFCWNKTTTPPSLSSTSRSDIDYILVYQKTSTFKQFSSNKEDIKETDSPVENKDNPIGELLLKAGWLDCKLEDGIYEKEIYGNGKLLDNLIVKNGTNINDIRIKSNFKWSQNYLEEEIKNGTKLLIKSNKISLRYLKSGDRKKIMPPNKLIDMKFGVGTNDNAKSEMKKLGLDFSYPKPVSLLKYILNFIKDLDYTVLDFFSGSATTAHAVMQLNAEDGGNRKFIMVQLNELTYDGKKEKYIDNDGEEQERYIIDKETGYPLVAKDSEARKEGFYTICEIGKERIRRAGELIRKEIEESNRQLQLGEEPKKVPDIGFKVFRTADTNINWKKIREVSKDNVMKFDDPDMLDFTLGFNDKDVVYEVLLRQRDLPLSEKLVTLTDIGSRTYLYADSYLVCLETNVTEELIEKLAELNPLPIKFIFRDSAFGSKIGLKEETFRRLKTLVEKNSGLTKKAYTVEFI